MSEVTEDGVRALSPRDTALRVSTGAGTGAVLGAAASVPALGVTPARLALPVVLAAVAAVVGVVVRRRFAAVPSVPVVFRVVQAGRPDWAPWAGVHRHLTVVARPVGTGAPFTATIINPTSFFDPEIAIGSVWTGRQTEPGLGNIVPAPATDPATEQLREAVVADPTLLPEDAVALPQRNHWAVLAGTAERAQLVGSAVVAFAAGLGLAAALG